VTPQRLGHTAMLMLALCIGPAVAQNHPAAGLAGAGQAGHPARGIVTEIRAKQRTVDISCDEIPGYMEPMQMTFAVHDAKSLSALRPGMTVLFTIVDDNSVPYAEAIHPGTSEDDGAEQLQAGGLAATGEAMDPEMAKKVVQPGEVVPDFVLTDQSGKDIHLTDMRGKVVVLTFGYSRCPFPQYCYRLSRNLSVLENRFAARDGRDLELITVAIDPEHDRGKVLSDYAALYRANAADWHFLTGPLPAVKQVSAYFGMYFWRQEGLLTHPLHTAVIDRGGNLVANIEGNHFTAEQLGDLVKSVMDRQP